MCIPLPQLTLVMLLHYGRVHHNLIYQDNDNKSVYSIEDWLFSMHAISIINQAAGLGWNF
jgi:hypothetical protein